LGGIFFSMNSRPSSRPLQWIVFGILFAVIAVIFVLFARERFTRAKSAAKSELPVYTVLRDFALTNQNNTVVTLDDLRGKVWVADIIFTRCPGPCRRMTKDMARLQDLWPKDAPVHFVSLTSDPEYDNPAVLKRYAEEFKADPARWNFLTGTKKQIVDAAENLKFVRVEKDEKDRDSVDDLFIHSTTFMIVDKRGQIRSVVETDQPDALTKARALVEELLRDR
jgi:protein SCO1/2